MAEGRSPSEEPAPPDTDQWLADRFAGLEQYPGMYGADTSFAFEALYMLLLDLWACRRGITHRELLNEELRYMRRTLGDTGCLSWGTVLKDKPLEVISAQMKAFRLEFQAAHSGVPL